MSWQLHFLGSGGWIPTEKRETCSVLFRSQERAILIDAGTGVRRLADQSLLDGVEDLSLVLTHFHLDHVAGLGWLEGLLPYPVSVYAPGNMLYGTKSEEIIRTFISPPFLSAPFSNTFRDVQELQEENSISGFKIFAREQTKHSLSTAALRIEDSLAYLTDTSFDEENMNFAQGVSAMLHEAWYTEGSEESTTHSSGKEAARVSKGAEAGILYLIHINPFNNENEVLRDARQVFPKTHLACDLEVISSE